MIMGLDWVRRFSCQHLSSRVLHFSPLALIREEVIQQLRIVIGADSEPFWVKAYFSISCSIRERRGFVVGQFGNKGIHSASGLCQLPCHIK